MRSEKAYLRAADGFLVYRRERRLARTEAYLFTSIEVIASCPSPRELVIFSYLVNLQMMPLCDVSTNVTTLYRVDKTVALVVRLR